MVGIPPECFGPRAALLIRAGDSGLGTVGGLLTPTRDEYRSDVNLETLAPNLRMYLATAHRSTGHRVVTS
jgi:hypothetical protein